MMSRDLERLGFVKLWAGRIDYRTGLSIIVDRRQGHVAAEKV